MAWVAALSQQQGQRFILLVPNLGTYTKGEYRTRENSLHVIAAAYVNNRDSPETILLPLGISEWDIIVKHMTTFSLDKSAIVFRLVSLQESYFAKFRTPALLV